MKLMFKKTITWFLFVIFAFTYLVGCSTSPDKITASYVSPIQYQNYSCNQIKSELYRINRKVSEVTGQQRSEATKDAIAMGVGLVLFWPALFFLIGDDKKEELARLKGEYDALESAAIQKECELKIQHSEIQKDLKKSETEIKKGDAAVDSTETTD